MKIGSFSNILLNFCTCSMWISFSNLKPVPDFEEYPEGCVHGEHTSNLQRLRRNIPDMAAVNPANLRPEAESQINQEELSDQGKNNEISSFVISNPMNEFFHSSKDKAHEKLPQQGPGGKRENLNEDDELVRREALSSDEQIECYKQQNIDPPEISDEPIRPLLKIKDQRPFTDIGQGNHRMLSRPLIYKERETKRLHGREQDSNEITSLYSEPERRKKFKKQKATNSQMNEYGALDQIGERSVFKPVGVRPEFPVYDEDIDFHPDPLQGILEDKYWLDPQEQEAVIRKYIDLANNMQPPRVEYEKRDASKLEHEPKSVDSKEAFRDAEAVDRDCPCREIAACGDCSKGKWKKKTNYSERLEDGYYGNRKLLSINYDENYVGINQEGNNFNGKTDSEEYVATGGEGDFDKYPSKDHDNPGALSGDNEEENQIEGEVPSFTSNFFGRKLLSFEDEDDESIDEGYGEDDDSNLSEYETSENIQIHNHHSLHHESKTPNSFEKDGKRDNRRSVVFDGDLNIKSKTTNENHHHSPISSNQSYLNHPFKPPNNSVYEYKLETEKIEDKKMFLKPNSAQEFDIIQKPFLNNPRNFAKYYVPNKFGNLMQKTLIRQKPKEASSTIDPDMEFAMERNETFRNVSINMDDLNVSVTTEIANLVKIQKRREQPVFLGGKGRRSYQVPFIKHTNIINKLQGSEESGNADVQGGNSTTNVSSTLDTTVSTTVTTNNTANTTDVDSNSTSTIAADTSTETVTTVNVTGNETTTKTKTTKKIEEYDEDSFDAEIANDIVETVIADSQSGSVVGHNLGLCRRNDSVSKYAKVSPESEQLLKKVTECILDRIRDRLEGQSCTLLDDDLLQFLKWMVLGGESYKDYLARINPELKEFKTEVHEDVPSSPPPPNAGKAFTSKRTT